MEIINEKSPPPKTDEIESESSSSEQVVVMNPWEVSGKIDYEKLIDKFGCKRLNDSLIDRVQTLTSRQPHVFLRRGVFFAHRDLNEILDAYEKGDKFYLYTGRGPSSEALHLGHLIPFMFTKYLQEAFKVPLVIQLTDDEKCIWKKKLSIEESQRLARENARDIIACGFDISKTFIFSDFDYIGGAFYENMVKIGKCLTYNKAKEIYGFSGEDHISKLAFPLVQATPCFPSSFPELFPDNNNNLRCLIPCASDQDSCFRMARDFAPRLGYNKPSLIESSFLPSLQGMDKKISTSDPNYVIYLTDTAKNIAKKINNNAYSGGKDTLDDHKIQGSDLKKDIPFKYLSFFLEDDDEFEDIKKRYGEGMMLPVEVKMLTGVVKTRAAEVLSELVEKHRKARADVTDEMVDAFMSKRPLSTMYKSRVSESYNKVIDESLIDRVKRLTCREPHVFLRRGIFFSDEDFNEILDAYDERGEMFYLYTGIRRGALHLGDLIPLMFSKYLQEAFDVPVVIQLSDDDDDGKKKKLSSVKENAKDVIACGFDIAKTFIFSASDYIGGESSDFYKNTMRIGDCVTINKARGIFGFTEEDFVAKYCFPSVQAAPSFPSSFPHLFSGNGNKKLRCLIPCAIDQDPYFRMTRDVAPKLGYSKPSLIESTFFPALQGLNGKMSASDPNSAIYVTDTSEEIAHKVKNAFSTEKEHRDLEEDIPFKYLSFFLEDDDVLEDIRKEYGEGRMVTEAVKTRLIEVLTEIVERHRRARAGVSDEMVDAFMAVRSLPTMFE